jgi:hypothetical protein
MQRIETIAFGVLAIAAGMAGDVAEQTFSLPAWADNFDNLAPAALGSILALMQRIRSEKMNAFEVLGAFVSGVAAALYIGPGLAAITPVASDRIGEVETLWVFVTSLGGSYLVEWIVNGGWQRLIERVFGPKK